MRVPTPLILIWLTAAALAPSPAGAASLDPARAITQHSHDAWQTRDGLPQNTISAIAQTPDGYLWLGTREGLVRFDGVRFTVFDTRTTPEIGHNQILALLADRDGRLWIGTWGGGLVRMEAGRFTRFTTKDGLPSDLISSLLQDRTGRMWIGTDGGGLARSEGDRFVAEPSGGALGKSVRAILEDDDGLWIGTEEGLARRLHDGTLTTYGTADGLSRQSVRSLLRDRNGLLWIGTDLGLNSFTAGRFTAYTRRDGLSHDVIVSLLEDRAGTLWIGTDGGGLNRRHAGRFTAFASKDGLTNDAVLALHEDREGSLWIGTNLGGLNRLKDGPITPLTTREGLSNDYIRAVYEDRSGALWIGTEGGGINHLADGRITAYTTKTGLANDIVFSILEDREGNLWVGTDNGLSRRRNGRFETFHAAEGLQTAGALSNDSVLALHEDRAGAVWIGTYAGGVNRYKDGRFTSFTTQNGLSNDTVNVIFEDRAGTIWIGTRGGGLNRYADGRLTALTTKDGLSDDLVFALHEDRDGSLWIGTYGGGLNRLKDGRIAVITERNGLYDDVIHRILEDGQGNFWLSSNKGIFSVPRSQLDAVANGSPEPIRPRIFGTADGMRNAECNGGANAGTITRNGTIWFPTIEGAVSLDPGRITGNTLAPPVVIEDVLVDGVAGNAAGAFSLPPSAQTLQIQFTALSLVDPSAVRFRYRLEGLETEWVDAGQRRTAFYSKLPAGSYRFQVVAANNNGVWNEEGAVIAFSVAARFYESLWFQGLLLLFFAAAGPLFHRVRIRRLTAQKAELERVIAERTAALEAANARLAQLASEDGLTGLLNRRAFDAALDEECRRANRLRAPLSLMLLDIDQFKAYNDRLGHQAGDASLRAVSDAVAGAHRRAGEVVARYGGEELAVILPGVAHDAARQLAETVRLKVQDLAIPHPDSAVRPVVTVSVGVASARGDGNCAPADLVAAADRAMYQAKQRGRNRVELATEREAGA